MNIVPATPQPALPQLSQSAAFDSTRPGGISRAEWQAGKPQPSAEVARALIAQLGTSTEVKRNNLVMFNRPLVDAIAAQGEAAVGPLKEFLEKAQKENGKLALIEGLYTAQKLAEAKTPGVDMLYSAVSRYNTSHDPLTQIYLAGFYRALNNPSTFGPLLSTLVHQSIYRYAKQDSPDENITEELGGTLLQQIANRTAEETVKRLLPYLNLSQPAPAQFSASSQNASFPGRQVNAVA